MLRPTLALLTILLITTPLLAAEGDVREQLGGRVGYISTTGGTYASYGDGWEAILFFGERIRPPLFIDVRIGAIYLGDLRRPEIAEDFTRLEDVASEMRILYLSIGPEIVTRFANSWSAFGSLEIGLYSVSILFDTGFQAFRVGQSAKLGGNATIGTMWHMTHAWKIDMSATLHTFNTSSSSTDTYYIFTGGDEDPIYAQVGIGISVDLR